LHSLADICNYANPVKQSDSRLFVRFFLSLIRTASVLTGLVAVCILLWWAAAPPAADAWRGIQGSTPAGGWSLDRLVTDALACVALIVGLCLAAATALTVLSAVLTTVRPSLSAVLPTWAPLRWRRIVIALCGLAVTTPVLTGPAFASDGDTSTCAVACPAPVLGLTLPDLPVSRSHHRVEVRPSRPTDDTPVRTIRVRPGDSLWTITATSAPPGTPDAAIAADVSALYATNREVIGPDPDLIYPGTTLTFPGDPS
jgi:hypothetical protein